MKRRQWTNKQKTAIVLAGLKGQPISELCAEHEIAQSQYYQWRDMFLKNASSVFETEKQSARELRLKKDNVELTRIIGDLTIELKKNEDLW